MDNNRVFCFKNILFQTFDSQLLNGENPFSLDAIYEYYEAIYKANFPQ